MNPSTADAIAHHDERELQPALHRAAIDAYRRSPVPALLQTVEALHKTLLAADPATLRRSVGWFGRLIGRDITLQAEGAALRHQLGVHARTAGEQIASLHAYRDFLSQHQGAMQSAAADLDAAADALEPAADQPEQQPAIGQRQHHLRTVAQAYRLTAAHLQATLLNHDQLLGHLALLLPRVQLLLEQDRMLRDTHARQSALSQAHTATEVMRTLLLQRPDPDLAPGESASHRSSP